MLADTVDTVEKHYAQFVPAARDAVQTKMDSGVGIEEQAKIAAQRGKKVVGSAQRRYGSTFLQHGSVLLSIDAARLGEVFPNTRNPLARLTTLETALGHRPKFDDVAAALAAAFEREHGLRLKPDGLTVDETARAAGLVEAKYGTAEWLAGPV